MRVAAYPNCCGSAVINDLACTRTSGGRTGMISQEDAEEELQAAIKKTAKKAIVSLIINSDQRDVYKDLLPKHGFRCVHKEFYGGHFRTLFMYVRAATEDTPTNREEYYEDARRRQALERERRGLAPSSSCVEIAWARPGQ